MSFIAKYVYTYEEFVFMTEATQQKHLKHSVKGIVPHRRNVFEG